MSLFAHIGDTKLHVSRRFLPEEIRRPFDARFLQSQTKLRSIRRRILCGLLSTPGEICTVRDNPTYICTYSTCSK